MSFSISQAALIREDVHDVASFILESGLFEKEHLPHTPFLVEQEGRIILIDNAQELLKLPDETVVMGQWPGRNRSDFFRFQVKTYREYYNADLIGKKGLSIEEIEAGLLRQKEETDRKLDRVRRDKIWQYIHNRLDEGNYVCCHCNWVGKEPETIQEHNEAAKKIEFTHICPQCKGSRLYAPETGWSTKEEFDNDRPKSKKKMREFCVSIHYVPFKNEQDREQRYRAIARTVMSAFYNRNKREDAAEQCACT